MGQEITTSIFSDDDFSAFKERLIAETDLLAQWFQEGEFADDPPQAGFELECCLVDRNGLPAPCYPEFFDGLDHPRIVPELAKFNLEINTEAQPLISGVFSRLADDLKQLWQLCGNRLAKHDAQLGMIGILPTLTQSDLCLKNMSPLNRYRALNEQVFKLRHNRPIELTIDGASSLHLQHHDVMLESAATSFQIHLQVDLANAAKIYNLSKIVSGPMMAVSANSPFLFAQNLWAETRVPVFEQSVSVGSSDFTKRVSFGIRYVNESLMETFISNLKRYPVLLPKLMDDPLERISHLRLHNGTIWRWNRPLIGFDEQGKPHLRIEHRIVPAGPSIDDLVANAALFYGLIFGLLPDPGVERRIGFIKARSNFYTAARYGINAELYWSDWQRVRAYILLQEHLLPIARTGLEVLGLQKDEIDYWLGFIQGRLECRQNGTIWQREWVDAHGMDMHGLTQAYLERQESGLPIYQWTV